MGSSWAGGLACGLWASEPLPSPPQWLQLKEGLRRQIPSTSGTLPWNKREGGRPTSGGQVTWGPRLSK